MGKNVKAEGEKLKLQQWHLEVVDEFRGEVPGWEESVVAKRVFALVVGEQRRREGRSPMKSGPGSAMGRERGEV